VLIQKKRGNLLEDFRVGQLFRHKVQVWKGNAASSSLQPRLAQGGKGAL
jgi:hypothetical protein